MKLSCPHCAQILELTPETLASFKGEPHFPCPVCTGLIAVPKKSKAPSPPAKNTMARKPTRADSIQPTHQGLNRNLIVLGVVTLVMLGSLGSYLAYTQRGDTHLTHEKHLREVIRNQFFTDLIASGATTEKALLGLWDIHEHGVGFVGLSEEACAWPKAAELAKRMGASVLTLDSAGTATRPPLLHSLTSFSADLGDATFWLLDHGEPKVLHAPEVDRVTTMDRPRRVLLAWRNKAAKN